MNHDPSSTIRFCPYCGTHLELRQQFGRQQPTCPACGYIHFADPKVAVAVLVEDDAGRVLLTRRVYPPHEGRWTLPSGFMDAFEDPLEAAARECLEETGLQVEITGLLEVISGREHPRGSDLLLAYRARVTGGMLKPGDDASEAAFFECSNLPPLAFSSTRRLLGNAAGCKDPGGG